MDEVAAVFDAVFNPATWLPIALIGCLRMVAVLSEAEHEEEFYEPGLQAG